MKIPPASTMENRVVLRPPRLSDPERNHSNVNDAFTLRESWLWDSIGLHIMLRQHVFRVASWDSERDAHAERVACVCSVQKHSVGVVDHAGRQVSKAEDSHLSLKKAIV